MKNNFRDSVSEIRSRKICQTASGQSQIRVWEGIIVFLLYIKNAVDDRTFQMTTIEDFSAVQCRGKKYFVLIKMQEFLKELGYKLIQIGRVSYG